MSGGEHYTWFNESDAESRKILYELENQGIAKINTEKGKNKGQYTYSWSLTKYGEELIDKNQTLKKLWSDGRVIEFYNQLKNISN